MITFALIANALIFPDKPPIKFGNPVSKACPELRKILPRCKLPAIVIRVVWVWNPIKYHRESILWNEETPEPLESAIQCSVCHLTGDFYVYQLQSISWDRSAEVLFQIKCPSKNPPLMHEPFYGFQSNALLTDLVIFSDGHDATLCHRHLSRCLYEWMLKKWRKDFVATPIL